MSTDFDAQFFENHKQLVQLMEAQTRIIEHAARGVMAAFIASNLIKGSVEERVAQGALHAKSIWLATVTQDAAEGIPQQVVDEYLEKGGLG